MGPWSICNGQQTWTIELSLRGRAATRWKRQESVIRRGLYSFFNCCPGSCHDLSTLVHVEEPWPLQETKFFTIKEYELGDVAYALSHTLTTRFLGDVTEGQKRFNKQHSGARTKIKHALVCRKESSTECITLLQLFHY